MDSTGLNQSSINRLSEALSVDFLGPDRYGKEWALSRRVPGGFSFEWMLSSSLEGTGRQSGPCLHLAGSGDLERCERFAIAYCGERFDDS